MYFDRFDICLAYYCYFVEHHGGQGSEEYARLSRLLEWFTPGPFFTSEDLQGNAQDIYETLVIREQGSLK